MAAMTWNASCGGMEEEAVQLYSSTTFLVGLAGETSGIYSKRWDLVDTRRAVRRLNGFRYYGCRIDVNLARLTAAFHTGKSPT
ncbi:hypothetical protein J1N35_040383 [Gossypium stocksii]|uniref:Uncharacterized protein n=1 Tax=Gossypium stocksii TaxID=47602 RepID=A0A9D3UDK7_9ROSI|nr:hypothetical protein J1N35_040383 [Gossypium stocksii]